jgi:branched-chain amino acid aminotransferase
MATVVSVNGAIGPPEAARIGVFDHGLLYGDSVYETMRAYGRRCFRLGAHLARLERSASLIGLDLGGTAADLAGEIDRTLAAAMNQDSAVRVMVTRGEGPIGLDPGLCPRPNRIVFVRPFAPLAPESYSAGVNVIVARTFRNSPRALDPEIKSGNFLNNILAQREAIAAGALEAVLLSQDGLLTEATQSNLFLVADGVVRTPHPRAGLLRGVTRAVVLELCQKGGLASVEEDLFVTSLYDAAEVFLTSTLKGIVPVTSIGLSRRRVGEGAPGPLTERLRSLYHAEVARFVGDGS